MIGADGQMQGIAGAQAYCVLVHKAGSRAKVQSRHWNGYKAVGSQSSERRKRLGPISDPDLPGPQLDREGGGELRRDPIADCEIVLRLASKPVLHPLGFRLVGQGCNRQRGVQIERQYRSSSRIRRIKSRAVSGCIGIASVMARNAATSMRFRGVSTAVICATALPRRVMHTVSPAAASSTSRLKCAFASARPTLFTPHLLTNYPVTYNTSRGPSRKHR